MKRAVLSWGLVWATRYGILVYDQWYNTPEKHLLVKVVSILALEGVVGCTCVCNLHPTLKYLEVHCPK